MWERVLEASPDLITPRIPLAAHYEQEGQHDRASAMVEQILRVRTDFTVQQAIDLLPGLERAIGSGADPHPISSGPKELRAFQCRQCHRNLATSPAVSDL
jgi:hypothetical protein